MTLHAYVTGIGVLGPGLASWPDAAQVLAGRAVYASAPTVLPMPSLLPSAERRRTGRVVKLALAVAFEATSRAREDPAELASVFTSSGGDGHNCHALCEALASASREISPTRFSNSVHNAAGGYWSIATRARLDSQVLCAHDASFGAGLLEAVTQVAVDRKSVLLVAYDTDYPEPLRSKRPIPDAFGVAMVLAPDPAPDSLARLSLALGSAPADVLSILPLECLRAAIPAARCLTLLERLARREAGRTVLDYLDEFRLLIGVDPCD